MRERERWKVGGDDVLEKSRLKRQKKIDVARVFTQKKNCHFPFHFPIPQRRIGPPRSAHPSLPRLSHPARVFSRPLSTCDIGAES